MANFFASYPFDGVSSSSAVISLNGETGALTLVAGSGISITPSGTNITIANTSTVATGNLTSTPTTNLVVTGGTGAVVGSGTLLTLTGASLVEATSNILTITGATNAVLGTGVSIQVKQASTSQSGYLSSTDWNTFNSKTTSTLTSGDIFVGNASNIAAAVAMSGDVHISNAGATSIVATTNSTLTTLSVLSLPASQLSGTVAIANGGTGQTTAAAAFNTLNPMTTTGDLIYESGTNIASRLAIGSTNEVLTVIAGVPTWATIGAASGALLANGSIPLNANWVMGPSVQFSLGGTITSTGLLGINNTSAQNPMAGTSQYGIQISLQGNTSGTTILSGVHSQVSTAASAYTLATRAGFFADNAALGAGSTVTNDINYYATAVTGGTNNAILADNTSFTGNWALNLTSANSSTHTGNFLIGTNAALTGTGTEKVTILNSTTNVTATNRGLALKVITSSNSTSGGTQGIVNTVERQITTSTSETGQILGMVSTVNIDVPTGQTYTNTGTVVTALQLHGPVITSGGTAAITNYYGLFFGGDSAATGTNKTNIGLIMPSGGTNNAMITDQSSFSGNWNFNIQNTSPSLLGGSLSAASFIPTGSTVPTVGINLPATNTIGFNTASTQQGFVNGLGQWVLGAGTAASTALVTIGPSAAQVVISTTTQRGLRVTFTGTSNAVASIVGISSQVASQASSFIVPNRMQFEAIAGTIGSGSIISNDILYGAPNGAPSGGTNNAILADNTSFTGNYALNLVSTYTSKFGGPLALAGSSSGLVTLTTQAAAGTYNFNLPITAGSAGQVLTSQGGSTSAMTWTSPTATFVAPTIQQFSSSTGTYTTPTSPRVPLYIKVRMIGGGGGGGGGGTGGSASNNGGTGGTTTFGTSLLTCNGGGGGQWALFSLAGGTASLGTGPIGRTITGGFGSSGLTDGSVAAWGLGGTGASTPFGSGGPGGPASAAGGSPVANTGAGGGGGSGTISTANNSGGGGGAAGGYLEAIIASPTTSYAYAIGAGGTAGGAAGAGFAGAVGGTGYIIVEEYYQ